MGKLRLILPLLFAFLVSGKPGGHLRHHKRAKAVHAEDYTKKNGKAARAYHRAKPSH